jgi:LL-diaminopimelate aminotransferase
VKPLLGHLTERRDAALEALTAIGLEVERPPATMYLWVALPHGTDTGSFTRDVLENEGVVLLPGTAFGSGGEGFFRIALTVDVARLCEGIERLRGPLERLHRSG